MPEATHEITAAYFPNTKEVELTWEHIETGEVAGLTTVVPPEVGEQIAKVVPCCVYHKAKTPNPTT